MEEFNFGKTSYPTQILVKSHLPVEPAVGEVLHQLGEPQGGHGNDAALPVHGGTALPVQESDLQAGIIPNSLP